jgi:hypothetical protein
MSGWISTFGAPRGHRVRFLYSSAGPERARTLECECGWGITYSTDRSRTDALNEHARHCDAVRLQAKSIGERDAAAELVERASSDDVSRFDDAPHPADVEES